MAYQTEAEWQLLFKRVAGRNFQIQKRIDAIQRDLFVGAPVGLEEGDSEITTRPLSVQEKNSLRQSIAQLANQNIADYQTAIAP